MAQNHIVELVDDLDGRKAAETVGFALDGTNYEIDLSKSNAQALRKALAPFVDASRVVTGKAARRNATRGPKPSAVREWANANGHELAERGRIPADVLAAYHAAN